MSLPLSPTVDRAALVRPPAGNQRCCELMVVWWYGVLRTTFYSSSSYLLTLMYLAAFIVIPTTAFCKTQVSREVLRVFFVYTSLLVLSATGHIWTLGCSPTNPGEGSWALDVCVSSLSWMFPDCPLDLCVYQQFPGSSHKSPLRVLRRHCSSLLSVRWIWRDAVVL